MRWPQVRGLILSAVLSLLLSGCLTPSCNPLPNRPSHHVEGGFCNPPGSPQREAGWPAVLADRIRMLSARYEGPVPAEYFVLPEQAIADLQRPPAGDSVSWLGHGTVLLRLDGRTILVDPIWSQYVSPLPPLGPKRVAPPPVPIEALPRIDVLLITHNDYDHLDVDTLRRLPEKDRVEVVAPLGVGSRLRDLGFSRVRELDWWQKDKVAGLSVWLLPAQHRSGRGLFDQNRSLWGSYALEGAGRRGSRVYLSGDTGHRGHFRQIGKQLGPFDLAIMNVGGYEPAPVAHAFHVTPEEAAHAVRELRARHAVAVHWGTYPLGTEPIFAPGPLFARAAQQAQLPPGTVRPLRIGETWAFRHREVSKSRRGAVEKIPSPSY